jgi:hypothetical protein
MSTVVNITTFAVFENVDPNNYSTSQWLIDPDMSQVVGLAPQYWSIDTSTNQVLPSSSNAFLLQAQNTATDSVTNYRLDYIGSGYTYAFTNTISLGSNPFTTTNGSTTVEVNSPNHGLVAGMSVTFNSSYTLNGATIPNTALAITVVDSNNFSVTSTTTATSAGSGGGTGISYNVTWSNTYDTDQISVQNIIATATAIANGIPLPSGFVWRDGNNINVPYTAAQFIALSATIFSFVNSCYVASWVLKAEIQALTTVAQVQAFDITQGWPAAHN